jgi:hypothetical protein
MGEKISELPENLQFVDLNRLKRRDLTKWAPEKQTEKRHIYKTHNR